VVVNAAASKYAQDISVGAHLLHADEPLESGGGDMGPTPYELLLAALGACTSMTLRMYAEQKQWPLQGVQVRLTHSRMHAEDCSTCDTKQGMLNRVDAEILLVGDLSAEQRERLMEIAERCPVHRTLVSEIYIRTQSMVDSPSSA
jgi:putative redox protein